MLMILKMMIMMMLGAKIMSDDDGVDGEKRMQKMM